MSHRAPNFLSLSEELAVNAADEVKTKDEVAADRIDQQWYDDWLVSQEQLMHDLDEMYFEDEIEEDNSMLCAELDEYAWAFEDF